MKLNENDKNTLIGSFSIVFGIAFIIFIIFVLTSCSVFESIYAEGSKHVSVTWKKDEAKNVIDSLLIQNKAMYYIANCDTNDFELDFERNGYSVWILKIGNKIRIETIKKDSLIYLYGK